MCDCEPPQAFYKTERKARREHRCYECYEPIEVGQKYVYISGVWDHRGDSFKMCVICDAVYIELQRGLGLYDCAPCYGSLWEEACQDGLTREDWIARVSGPPTTGVSACPTN